KVIYQAPADYFTVGWLTSILQQRSFGIVMLFLGLLATIPVGSTVPGLMLAAMAVQLIAGRGEPVFPHFITTRRLPTRHLLRLGGRASFQSVKHPLILTPGDNDWTDCVHLQVRKVDALQLLSKVRTMFFPEGRSLGQRA